MNKASWCWRDRILILVLLSVVTGLYGWHFDQILLLPAAISGGGVMRRSPFARGIVVADGFERLTQSQQGNEVELCPENAISGYGIQTELSNQLLRSKSDLTPRCAPLLLSPVVVGQR
jgi:hypothetical protein